jgi:hypothetical protein
MTELELQVALVWHRLENLGRAFCEKIADDGVFEVFLYSRAGESVYKIGWIKRGGDGAYAYRFPGALRRMEEALPLTTRLAALRAIEVFLGGSDAAKGNA